MSATVATGPALETAAAGRVGIVRRLSRRPAAVVSAVTIAVLLLLSLLATPIAGSPTAIDTREILASPSGAHWLGTDDLGRDVLARTLAGGRLTLLVAFGAMAVSMAVGTLWGFVAAAAGRAVGEGLMRAADACLAIPPILLALILVAAFGASSWTLALISGLLLAPQTARIARSALLTELRSDYRLAARAVGVSPLRTVFGELLPNASPALIAQASLTVAWAIGIEASLSFLGLGVQPPEASWGTLLQEGYAGLYRSVWLTVVPGVAIFVAILAFNTFGSQLQQALDPRQEER
ncbi:ABC transporter permease [Conexibacter arvalis]|uniref:ABC-type dipeptide/oligopeptide/nickel transport system permease subunit n=1 Tax=Conexibacter arvalis TaxID=912552 RepID=A0A840IJE6_9ACTN|nr:ABC transporter permease [Conexibacter arvalis]MBB4664070.1 ABC-type dipeptide/oligopeptide/nickel transport system permease subunit [Conexibacter arvalis]